MKKSNPTTALALSVACAGLILATPIAGATANEFIDPPMLKEKIAAGKLAAAKDRLPQEPKNSLRHSERRRSRMTHSPLPRKLVRIKEDAFHASPSIYQHRQRHGHRCVLKHQRFYSVARLGSILSCRKCELCVHIT